MDSDFNSPTIPTFIRPDYGQMVHDGLLLEDAEPFAVLIDRCADIEARANRAGE